MFLHENTNEYNLYFNKVENVPKRSTVGPKVPQCNMTKKPFQKSALQSLVLVMAVSGLTQ